MAKVVNSQRIHREHNSDIADARIFLQIETDEGRFSGDITYRQALDGMGDRIMEQTGVDIKGILSRSFRDAEHYLDSAADRAGEQGTLDLGNGIIKPLNVIYRNGQSRSYESWIESGRLRHLPLMLPSFRFDSE